MTLKKEEISALILAALAVVMVIFGTKRIVFEGLEFSSRGRSPIWGVIVGAGCLAVAAYQIWKGSIGEPDRNGRRERPLVFWSSFLAFAISGVGFVVLGLFAANR
jgi:hypothetical protein